MDAALAAFGDDWDQRASAAARRRFGTTPPGDWDERARRARFLQQRGFPADVVRRVTAFDDTAADD
ncbi:MAG: RecX family transcriptional regulator [Halofilum sp. (in: g-proteobacteria)]|nr:RecX family transcriptional regulator [Halofilum sp. (in: g-proteobacteria)]